MSRLDVDEVAVERLVTGRWSRTQHGEPRLDDVVAALQLLRGRQASLREIGEHLGAPARQVSRWLADLEAGRPLGTGRRVRSAA